MGVINHSDARGPAVPAGSRIDRNAYTGTGSAFGHAERTEDKPTDNLRLRFSAATAGQGSNIATASSGLETAAKLAQLATLIKKCGVTHPTTYKFVETLYNAWKEQGRYLEAEPLLGHILAFDKEVYGSGSDWTLYTEHEIAENVFLQGRLNEAEKLAEAVLKKAKEAFGEWNAQTNMTESLLGLIYCAQGNYADAIRQQRRCWRAFQHALGPTAPETIRALKDLSIAMRERGGQEEEVDKVEMEIIELSKNQAGEPAPEAVAAVGRLGREKQAAAGMVLSKKKDEFGKEHAETVDAMADVAHIYYARGLLEDAESMQTEVSRLTTKVLGQKSFKTVEAMNRLATTWWALGKFVEAKAIRKQVLGKSTDILGPKHPDTIKAMASLASAYASNGRSEEALAMDEQVLILRREVLQPWHGDTLASLASLADRWSALGKYNDAVVARREILQHITAEHNKKDHPEILDPEVLAAMELLAESLIACERYKEAEQVQRDAHHHLRRLYGVQHCAALNMWSTLADTLHYQGLFQQSVRNEMEVYEIRKNDWGETHPETIEAVAGIARGLGGMRRHKEAVVLERHILEYRKECLGPAHLESTWAQENLAAALSHLGREEQEEAEVLRDEVLRFRTEELGEKDRYTLDALEKIASSWTQLGLLQEAEDAQVKVLHHRIEILGMQHPETIWAMRHLSRILHIEGKWEKANQNMSIVVKMLTKFLGAEHPKTVQAIREQTRMPQERHGNPTPAEIMRRIDENERVSTGTSGTSVPEEKSNADALSTVQEILRRELECTKAAISLRMLPSPMTMAKYEYKVKLCGEDTRTLNRARKSMDGRSIDYAWDIDDELASTPQYVVLLRRQAMKSSAHKANHEVKDLLHSAGRVQAGEEEEYAKLQDAKKEQNRQPKITLQIAVDKEDLETVLTPTIMSLQAAISGYQAVGGSAKIFITDDGLGSLPRDKAEARRQFYKANNIGWVARPRKMQHGATAKGRMTSSREYGLTIAMMTEDELARLIKNQPKVDKRPGEKLPPWALKRQEEIWMRYPPTPWRRVENVPDQDDVTAAMAESLDDEVTKAKKEQDRLYQTALDNIISRDGSFWADGDIRIGEFIVRVEAGGRLAEDSLAKAVGEEFWDAASAGYGRKYLYLDRKEDSEKVSEEATKTNSGTHDANQDVNIDAASQGVIANEPVEKKKRQFWKKMLKH